MTASLHDIRAIVFDLDDTLCGYWDASKAALLSTFQTVEVPGQSAEEMVQHWAAAFREFSPTLKKTGWYQGYLESGGPTRVEQMRLTLQRAGIDDPEKAKQLSDLYGARRNANLKLFPESLEVLNALQHRYPMAVLTNGPADIQRQELATLGISDFFAGVYIEGEMGLGKPHRKVFTQIEGDLQTGPSHMLMVGNSYAHDVRAALEAGWKAVWVRRPSDVPPSAAGTVAKVEEKPEGSPEPDAIISDLRQLLPLLESE